MNSHKYTLFYVLTGLAFVFILLSNPFLKIPYDMWEHLIRIVSFYENEGDILFYDYYYGVTNRGTIWYYFWATFFKLIFINDIFIWAKIIHVIQFTFSAFAIFFFSKTVFDIFFPGKETNRYLALCSAFFWFTGNGLHSVAYHNSWIMWYSLNYQCATMSMLWFALALTLRLVFIGEEIRFRKIGMMVLIGFLFVLIVLIHPLEAVYYLIHLLIIGSVCYKKVVSFVKNYYWYVLIIIVVTVFTIVLGLKAKLLYLPPDIKTFLDNRDFIFALKRILEHGKLIIGHYNKFPNAYSELNFLSVFLVVASIPIAYFYKKSEKIRIYFYILLTTIIFFSIPNVKILAGFFGFCIIPEQVYRFINASTWFIVIPTFTYMCCRVLSYRNRQIGVISVLVTNLVIFLLFLICSKYLFYGSFYKNVKSLMYSLKRIDTGKGYDENVIKKLGDIIKENPPKTDKIPLYCIRGDMAYLLRGVYRKRVFTRGKNGVQDPSQIKWHINQYKHYLKINDKKLIDIYSPYKNFVNNEFINIDLPYDFPKDETIFRDFPQLEKQSDTKVKISGANLGIVGEIIDGNKIIQSFKGKGRITQIYLLMANYSNRNNTEDVILRIKDNPNSDKDLAYVKVNAAKIRDNNWHRFYFPPVILSENKPYYLIIESPKSSPGNAVTAYRTNSNVYTNGDLIINGKKTDFDLCVKIIK